MTFYRALGVLCVLAILYGIVLVAFLVMNINSGNILASLEAVNLVVGAVGLSSFGILYATDFLQETRERELPMDPILPLSIIYNAIIGIYDGDY